MKFKTFVSVVVYVRDDAEAVGRFIAEVGPWLEQNFSLYEIVLVDDASASDVRTLIADTANQHRVNVVVIRLSRRHGVEAGIKAGLDWAMGDWVFELESARIDFPPSLFGEMYLVGSQGYDIVTASGDDGPLRSRVFYRFVNHYADLDTPLRTERVRLTSRRAVNAMLAVRDKVRYRKALYAVLGWPHHHLRYQRTAVPATPGRQLDRETSSLAFDILLSFSGFGLRLAHRLSIGFGALSLGAICYALVVFFTKSNVIEGWTTLTVLLSGGFAGVFLILGILGEYLARILVEVRGRPLYSVRDTMVYTPTDSAAVEAEATPAFLLREVGSPELPERPETGPMLGTVG